MVACVVALLTIQGQRRDAFFFEIITTARGAPALQLGAAAGDARDASASRAAA
eukprot:COSAG02_NODE_43162_length_377_cov_1.075540_1_plen_52_part_01